MNLYELASQDEAWGAFTLDDNDDGTPLSAWPADPPAPMPLDAALQAAAREYGVDADVLRALGHGGSVDSIFGTAASLRSRLEAFDGDYAQALASYRREEEGNAGDALAAPAVGLLSPPPPADARMPAPAPEPSARPTAAAPWSRPARPQATAPVPGAPPSQATRPDQPPAPPDGRLGAADDPRSLVYRPAPAAQKPLVDAASSQPGRGTDTASFAPVRPEVRQALGNAWDTASPGERQRMQSMPGWQGQLARERAAQYAQADKGVLAASPTAALLDGRAENRAKAPPATDAAPRAAGNGRAQSQTALRSTTPAGAAEPAPLPQRSWGEAISDATKSAAQGILDVASLPGVAYSAVTGDYDTSYLNAIRGTQEVLQDEKSPAFQAQAQALQQKLATAEGWREKLAVGGWETLKNPTLLGDTLARSAPGMLAGGLIGRAAGGAADAVGNALLGRTIATGSEAAARSAVALKNAAPAIASGTAVGAAAAQQGASVANDLYAELRKLPASAFAAEPEFQQLARDHGPDKARDILAAAATTRALLVGTGASVLSMKLVPGGDAIEKAFLPSHLKGGAAREAVKSSSFLTQPLTRGMQGNLGTQALEIAVQGLKHGTTGSITEGAEEASGAVAQGLELSRAGQDVKLGDMAGEAAGQGMAAGFAMDGAAGTRGANAAPRVQDQPTQPGTPPASPPPTATTMARGQKAPEASTASGPAVPPSPSPAATLAAALLPGYSEALQPGSRATWSNAASATRKAQAEAEILRQAEALPAQEAATSATATPSPAAPSATPTTPMPASTDGNSSSTQQGANALPQGQVNSDADQAATATQASATDPAANALGTPAPAPTPSTLNTEADASAAETAPTTTQHGTARQTAAAQVQPPTPAPIDAQIQALDSGMLVVGGDQATILAHLQAGGVRGAEPFAGVTLVPVDQAALAQRVLSRPLAAPAGPVGTQAGSGSQHAPATAALPRSRTAAQLAPSATRAPTAGDTTAGPSPVGASAPRTEGRHGSPASAAASQPAPVMEMQRDGTLMVRGDPVQLQERLRQGGVERVLRREGGVLVGLDQVGKARQLLQPPPPCASASADHSLPSPLSGQQFSRNASASKAEDGSSPASRYSTRSTPPKAELSLERIDQVIQETLAGVAGAPPVKAVGSPGDIGLVVPAKVVASGITLGSGDIYVFQSGVGSDLDVRLVVFHELLHRGVRFLVPRAQYVQTMLDLAASDTRVQQYANEWKRTGIVPQQREQLARLGYTDSELQGQLEAMAIEEGLARISEELNVDLSMGTRWQPSRIRALAQWLATVADKAGMARLARAIRAMTYNEAERFVMRAIEHAGRKGGNAQGNSQARFNTTSAHQSQGSGAAGAGALQFSRPAATKTAYEARIDALFAGAPANRTGVTVLDSSDMLGLLGYAATPLYLQESKVLQGQLKHPHMTASEWMKVPQWLESPAAVFDSDTVAGRLVVVAPETVQGSHVLMIVEPDAEIGSAALRLHLLVNAYDKDDGPPPYGRWLRDGLARYVDQKKFPTILAQAGLRLPSTAVQNKPVTRRILSEKHLAGYRRTQGEGPGARPGAHTSQGLPSQPATVQSVKAAVAKLTNSMGLLAEGRGRVVVATSADIQAHWEPLVGEVDMGTQDTGLAQGFFDTKTDTVFLIADHIEAGQEMAVAAHELVHKHGKAVLGEARWRQLHQVIGSWANRPEGSLERRVYDEAMARVRASRPDSADAAAYSSEELFPYAVQVAMELGVQPTALMPANSVQGWLARVRAAMRGAWDRLTNKPELFDSQDLVDLAFAVAQRENPAQASEFEGPSALAAPKPGITAQQARDIADKVLKGLGMRGKVTPTIMENPTAAGLVAPESMPSGGVSDGRLYLFLEGIRDEVEGFRVVFHELFHLGLSQSVTLQEYRQTMLHLLADPLVRKYAARWKNSEDGHSRRSSMPINNWHALAVEEALADMAEEIHHERGGVGTREMADWVRRTIAWMADLAHRWDMPKVARRLRGMTQTQAEAFVAATVLKARTGAPVLLPDARWATSRSGRDPAAEAAYELMYRRGQAAMGETGWQQLLGPIDSWAQATEGSTERQIYDEAVRLMQASLHGEEATAYGSAQALFPYAVQAALQVRIQPTAKKPVNTAAGWLARVRSSLRSTWNKLATDKGDFNSMDLVDLAFGLAQQANPVHRLELDAVAQALSDETAQLLSSISGAEDLFSLPRSRKDTVADIAAEHSPSIEVRKTDLAGETKYTLLLPDGTVATITSREPTPHEVFGMDDASGQWITERPGEKAPPVGARSDVWVDVSRLEQGKWGGVIYNIAATFAHNTGRIFIGDPSGLKDIALRRRSEQMLASALKFGTTDHLAPHPRQVAGDARLGVPPLLWVYGDSVGNIQRLIDVNLATLENAFPDARNLTYDLDTGHFIDARTGDRLSKEALARSADASRAEGAIPAAGAGWRTIARGAVLHALLGRWADARKEQGAGQRAESGPDRGEVLDGAGRQSDQPASPRNGEFERGRSTLAGIAEQRDRLASDDREQRIFYSRSSEVAR